MASPKISSSVKTAPHRNMTTPVSHAIRVVNKLKHPASHERKVVAPPVLLTQQRIESGVKIHCGQKLDSNTHVGKVNNISDALPFQEDTATSVASETETVQKTPPRLPEEETDVKVDGIAENVLLGEAPAQNTPTCSEQSMPVVDVPVQARDENVTLAGENLSSAEAAPQEKPAPEAHAEQMPAGEHLSSTVADPQEQQPPETHSEQVPVAEISAEGLNQADVGASVEEKAKIGPVNCFACSRDSVRALFYKAFAKPRTA